LKLEKFPGDGQLAHTGTDWDSEHIPTTGMKRVRSGQQARTRKSDEEESAETHLCGTSRSLQGAGILLYDGVLSMTNFSTTSGTPPTTPEDWAALVHLVNRTIQQLQRKPVELRGGYYLEPGSILNAYREGDLTFDAAKKALETWRERGVR
jgi:hypothetical protein